MPGTRHVGFVHTILFIGRYLRSDGRAIPNSVWPLLTHQELFVYYSTMGPTTLSTKKAVELFHALLDETRLALLDRLKAGEQCVCELTEVM